MKEILLIILKTSAVIAIPASTLVLGLRLKRLRINEFLDNRTILLKYILSMFIISPLIAVIYYFIFRDFQPVWIALMVISLSPPSPGVIKKIGKIGINHNVSMILLFTGIILSLIMIPLVLMILESFLKINIDLGIDDVFLKIAIIFIIPIATGFFINYKFGRYSDALIKFFDPLSKIAMLVLVICVLIAAVPVIISSGIIPVLLVLLFQVTLLMITHFISGREKGSIAALPFSALLRLPAPAIVISQVNGSLDKNLSTILLSVILGTLVILVYSRIMQYTRGLSNKTNGVKVEKESFGFN